MFNTDQPPQPAQPAINTERRRLLEARFQLDCLQNAERQPSIRRQLDTLTAVLQELITHQLAMLPDEPSKEG